MKTRQKAIVWLLVLAMVCSMVVTVTAAEEVRRIELSAVESSGTYTHTATLDGVAVPEYDYTWHADPKQVHEDVKNSPAEYYTGTEPGDEAVYIAHDIIYYPELDENKFQKVNYDGDTEWVYMYEAEGYEDYIFSTLPNARSGLPTKMMHSPEEAYENAVLHITEPGTYELTGTWHGQVKVDLGDEDDVYADPTQKVTLILNGVDITCTVAPGVMFTSVYECDNTWEDADSYSHIVDTTDAGAVVVLADGTVNNVTGTNVFRILKTKYKDDDSTDQFPAQKKSWKIDGAFYSYQSMNIEGGEQGTGVLNITAGFEGLDTEHHLTINGGHVNIYSQDDGINVNEDGVSVLTVNGGGLHICAGLGDEGDGIDSNGFVTINGGTVISAASPMADSGLDSDRGSFVNGGTVVALGSTMDWAEADESGISAQPVMNMQFASSQSADEAIVITDTDGKVVFAYDPDKDEVTGDEVRTYRGAIISAPGLTMGGSYHVYIGGDVEGSEVSGVYDVATVTGFTDAVMQSYSGNFTAGRPGGMMPADRGERPEMPEGFDLQNMPQHPGDMGEPPDGVVPGQRPDDFDLENMLQYPDDMPEPPEDIDKLLGKEEFDPSAAVIGGETVFVLTEQVNAFANVSDYVPADTADEAAQSGLSLWIIGVAAVIIAACIAGVILCKKKKKAA